MTAQNSNGNRSPPPRWERNQRRKVLKTLGFLPSALPEDQRFKWCKVIIYLSDDNWGGPLHSETARILRGDLLVCLNAGPFRTVPFLGALTVKMCRPHSDVNADGSFDGWWCIWRGLVRIPWNDLGAQDDFRHFMYNFDVSAVEFGQLPSTEAAERSRAVRLDLIYPSPERLLRSTATYDPRYWDALQPVLLQSRPEHYIAKCIPVRSSH